MRPIPQKLKDKMSSDPFYEYCCICGVKGVQYHHNLIFASRQINEEFCILPLCPECHGRIDYIKDKVDWIMLNRATDEELDHYSKAINYRQKKKDLNKKYGKYVKKNHKQ